MEKNGIILSSSSAYLNPLVVSVRKALVCGTSASGLTCKTSDLPKTSSWLRISFAPSVSDSEASHVRVNATAWGVSQALRQWLQPTLRLPLLSVLAPESLVPVIPVYVDLNVCPFGYWYFGYGVAEAILKW